MKNDCNDCHLNDDDDDDNESFFFLQFWTKKKWFTSSSDVIKPNHYGVYASLFTTIIIITRYIKKGIDLLVEQNLMENKCKWEKYFYFFFSRSNCHFFFIIMSVSMFIYKNRSQTHTHGDWILYGCQKKNNDDFFLFF